MSELSEKNRARMSIIQAIYEMEMTNKGVHEVSNEFESYWKHASLEGVFYGEAERCFFVDVLSDIVNHQDRIDYKIHHALSDDWPISRIESVLRAILRTGAYELLYRTQKCEKGRVIADYLKLTVQFYNRGKYTQLVHAVLDKIVQQESHLKDEPKQE